MGVTKILLIVLLMNFVKCEEEDYNRKMNVGTVLFTDSDNSKDCWTTESIALLTSRMMLEDVLPSREVLIIKDTAFVTDLIDYFRLVLEVVRQMTYGKTKHIMLLALTDTLGGYLNRFVIPTAKHAYYAGYIDFDSMERLYQLFDELKCFLRTNGHGWAEPIKDFSRKMEAQPLPVQSPAPKTDPCRGLILINKHDFGLNSSGNAKSNGNTKGKHCEVEIPMPFFDSKIGPSAIAMPFKTYALRNMESKSASYVLVKFYMAATKCLAQNNANKKSVDEFNSNLYSWIHSQVFPHLNDDKFYAAFGGVLRIEETLSKMGAVMLNNKEMGNYNIMPDTQMKDYSKGSDDLTKRKKSNLILLALLATIFIWFILGSMFICYRIKAAKVGKADQCYCGVEKMEPKSSSSSKQSKMSSKISKMFSSQESGTSKKPSISSRSSKKTTTSSRISPAASAGSIHTTASGHSGVSGASNRKLSPTHSVSSGSESSSESKSSRAYDKKPKLSKSAVSGESGGSRPRSAFRKKRSKASFSSKQLNKDGAGSKTDKSESKTKRPYPTSCACHTTMTAKLKPSSSSEEQMKKKDKEIPLVFGYELDTSSESSQREQPNEDPEKFGESPK